MYIFINMSHKILPIKILILSRGGLYFVDLRGNEFNLRN